MKWGLFGLRIGFDAVVNVFVQLDSMQSTVFFWLTWQQNPSTVAWQQKSINRCLTPSSRDNTRVRSGAMMRHYVFSTLIIVYHVGMSYGMSVPAPKRLQQLLQAEMDGSRKSTVPILLPCCYDGLTARLVARAGFEATFMTGFGVSAVNGYPDTQLVSYAEMQSAASTVAEGLSSVALELGKEPIPCIADGDTGYGNAVNVKRVSLNSRGVCP